MGALPLPQKPSDTHDRRSKNIKQIRVRSADILPGFYRIVDGENEEEKEKTLDTVEVSSRKSVRLEFDLNKPNPEIIIHTSKKTGSKEEKIGSPSRPPPPLKRTQSMLIGKKKKALMEKEEPFRFIEIGHMSTASFPKLTPKKDVSLFNKALVLKLERAWREAIKPELNVITLNDFIDDFCFDRVDTLFHEETLGKLSAEEFEIRTIEFAKLILGTIKTCAVPAIPIIERFNIFLKAFKDYLEEKNNMTLEGEELYQSLEKLTEWGGWSTWKPMSTYWEEPNIENFLMKYEYHLHQQSFKTFREFLTIPFGDKREDRRAVFKALAHWNSPPVEAKKQFYEKIESIFRKEIRVRNITAYDHLWIEDRRAEKKVSSISHHDIFRSILYGESVLFQKIYINGELFYDEIDNGKPESRKAFYTEFFGQLYRTKVDGKYSEEKVKNIVEYAEKIINTGEGKIPKEDIPILNALLPCTINTWIHAFNYLRYLFPALFTTPLHTKECKDEKYKILTCHINVTEKNNCSVSIIRNYAIYESDGHGAVIDRDKPLALFPVKWTMEPYGDGLWKGCLTIEREVEYTEHLTVQNKRKILDVLSAPTDPDLCVVKKDKKFGIPKYRTEKREPRGLEK